MRGKPLTISFNRNVPISEVDALLPIVERIANLRAPNGIYGHYRIMGASNANRITVVKVEQRLGPVGLDWYPVQ